MGERGRWACTLPVWYVPEKRQCQGRAASTGRDPAAGIIALHSSTHAADARTPSVLGSKQPTMFAMPTGPALKIQAQRVGGRAGRNAARLGTLLSDQHARRQASRKKEEKQGKKRTAGLVPERRQSALSSPAPHRSTVRFLGEKISALGGPAWPDRGCEHGQGRGTAQPSLCRCNGPMQATHATLRGRRPELHSSLCPSSL